MTNKVLVLAALLSTFSMPIKAAEETNRVVVVVVENNNGKELAENVDPFLASTVAGLKTIQNTTASISEMKCDCNTNGKDGAYVSYAMGNGKSSDGDSMQWRAFDLRVGKSIDENTRVDVIHINEGHPTNNHRDGFAIQGLYDVDVAKNLRLEVGAGPYFSMNTTSKNNVEKDDKNLGILTTVAALYYLDDLSPGLHLRAEYNHVIMPGAIDTNSVMIGIGKNFGGPSNHTDKGDGSLEVGLIGNHFKTNHGGTEAAQGYQVEMKKMVSKNSAISLSYMNEGKDSMVDRDGIATQVWYVEPLSDKWSVSAGAGPYVAKNKLESNQNKVSGLISIEIKRDIGSKTTAFVRINRIADFKEDKDRDILSIGVSRKF
jgi:hypothetical protein